MKEGFLKHNLQGRYEIQNGTYFTSGESIELLVNDAWIMGRIEYSHKHEDYYFIANDGKQIYGLTGKKAREVN